ncbi:HIRAN domain-containing protein [Clostridium chromiireducens]|uniref:HIRAN domain-containing protein n=1 Tax=Clostridium chromiireducens TaxID=225345 RepID=UPI003AF42C41
MSNDITVISGNAGLINIIDNGELTLPFQEDIYLYTLPIAGINYYIDKNLDINEKDILIFKREPDNEYDKYAIIVYSSNNEKLGYIPRKNNRIFARLIDAGKLLIGEVKSVTYFFDEISEILIRIYMKEFL